MSDYWRFGAMNTDTRERLIDVLAEIARRCPNLRYGQLVENMAGLTNVDTWDIEDDELLRAASQFLETAAIPLSAKETVDR
jgi:hypothetical protein